LHPRTANQQGWDKLLFPLLQIFLLSWLVILSVDAHDHWSSLPAWLRFLGLALLLGSLVFLFTAFRENSYLSPVVRIQGERGHKVVSSGPYRYVRHPMYSAILIFVVGTSLFLGSAYGLIYGLLCLILLARRAVLEERTLGKELPGYSGYTAKVRYRLIPHIW
jgi:protein-S-isoprenylcysteine O-methyltransferase Ste14